MQKLKIGPLHLLSSISQNPLSWSLYWLSKAEHTQHVVVSEGSLLDQHQLLSNPFQRPISVPQYVLRPPPTFIYFQHSVEYPLPRSSRHSHDRQCALRMYISSFTASFSLSLQHGPSGFPTGVAGEVCFYRGHRVSR